MARNGKFSRGLSGWTTSGVELSNNQGIDGSKCAKFTFKNSSMGYLQQVFPIEPACTYKVTCWVKWTGCRQLVIARSGSNGWEYSHFAFENTQSNTFKKFEISYLSSENPNATGLNLVFYVYKDSNATGSEAYIDKIEINGTVPTRRGSFWIKAPCPVYSKATGNKLDTCPTGRRLYAYYEDGDTISLHWPSKGKPTAIITLDDNLIGGSVDPNFTWSDSARILQVVMNEVGRTLDDFGNVADPWCQTLSIGSQSLVERIAVIRYMIFLVVAQQSKRWGIDTIRLEILFSPAITLLPWVIGYTIGTLVSPKIRISPQTMLDLFWVLPALVLIP